MGACRFPSVLIFPECSRFLVAKKSMPGAGLPAAPGLMEAAKGLIVGAAQRPELRGFGATQNSEEGLATARFF